MEKDNPYISETFCSLDNVYRLIIVVGLAVKQKLKAGKWLEGRAGLEGIETIGDSL